VIAIVYTPECVLFSQLYFCLPTWTRWTQPWPNFAFSHPVSWRRTVAAHPTCVHRDFIVANAIDGRTVACDANEVFMEGCRLEPSQLHDGPPHGLTRSRKLQLLKRSKKVSKDSQCSLTEDALAFMLFVTYLQLSFATVQFNNLQWRDM
jgi:hypothetical protein